MNGKVGMIGEVGCSGEVGWSAVGWSGEVG